MQDYISIPFVLSLALLTASAAEASSQAWANGYTYQATFTVAAGQAPSALANFPALISGTFADFAASADGGRISNTCTQTVGNNTTAVPCDLIFTSDAAGATLLNWEFETWMPATGAVNIWVNVPNLANGTVVYAWYGQPSVTTLQTSPAATWSSNFMAVYHLKENPAGTAPQMNDSTANANHATMNGAVQASQQQPGEIGGSVNFEGNTWAGLANPANFSFERTDSFSLSGWFKFASNAAGTLLSKFPAVPSAGWALMQEPGPVLYLGLFGANNGALAATPDVSLGAWHYVVATYSGTSTVAGMQIYVDGVNKPLTTIGDTLASSMVNNLPAAINGRAGPNQMSTATMDELRISTKGVVLSPAWVTASFNNQSQPGAFFTAATGITATLGSNYSSLAYGGVPVNPWAPAYQTATIINIGTVNIAVSGMAIGGEGGAYSAASNPAIPFTLAPNQTAAVTVTFAPAVGGTATGQVSIVSNATNSPLVISLNGSGSHWVSLSWNASETPKIVGYNVYGGTVSGGPYVRLSSLTGTAYEDTSSGIVPGSTRYYVVTAVDGAGVESSHSSEVRALIPTP